ncbi:MAG: PAS domain S-box protein [Acidobacteriota bacterium]|nr:PAS domain S-box protein [Acidobacteriota bacterium]
MSKEISENVITEDLPGNPVAPEDFLIVGIGASAGGIKALKSFFGQVPADSGMAYVVILHLSPDHDSQLAAILQTTAAIPVAQVTEQTHLEPNHVYVVPPDKSLRMLDGSIVVSDITRVEERRAPVDIFFRTLAESHDSRAVAVILSGTGANGSMGVKRIKEKGGVIFVQDPKEAEYEDMPRHSLATGLVDDTLRVAEIPAKIIAYRDNLGKIQILPETETRTDADERALRDIFTHLRVKTGHDFSNYKRATVLRRIERRINVRELKDLLEYADFMCEQPEETDALLRDLLISVTNFFRDRYAFDALETQILPKILEGKTAADTVRVWVAGCATGEEAYSLAMLLAEKTSEVSDAPHVQIFATDIDEKAIAFARDGLYTLNDAADVSPERLRRFFIKEGEGYRVRREIRELVLFAAHNLIKDAPFSHLDLTTCRNLLIYLNRTAQSRVMEIVHFALNPNGYFFLGSSESIEGAGDLFTAIDKENHIFQSRPVTSRLRLPLPLPSLSTALQRSAQSTAPIMPREQENRVLERLSYADLHQQLLEQYAPPSIVVNEEYDILHLSERAGRYLKIAGGEPTFNLLKVVRQDLRLELRTALYQAVQRRTNVEALNLPVVIDERTEIVNIHVRPSLRTEDAAHGFVLVIFERTEQESAAEPTEILGASQPVALQLEEELIRTKAQLRATTEQYETQTEEYKASNEELQAMNEELRSAAEELETGKEELQSLNEELQTVNQELKIKIEEISQSNNDFRNLINSTDIGTIFLDRSLRVSLFSPAVRSVFNLIPADLGRSLTDITNRLIEGDITADAETVLEKLHAVEREIKTVDGRVFMMCVLPYRTAEDRISGVVITFVDITRRQRNEEKLLQMAQELEQQARLFDTTLTNISDFAYTFGRDGRFVYSNKPLLDLLQISPAEIVGKNFFELGYPEDLAARLQRQIQEVFDTGKIIRDETPFTGAAGESGFYEYIFTPVYAEDGSTVEFVSGSTRDVTTRRHAEDDLRESAKFTDTVLDSLPAQTAVLDKEGKILSVNQAWRQFACDNAAEGALERSDLGVNYLQICRPAEGAVYNQDSQAFDGIEAVLHGDLSEFSMEYPCHSPHAQRWFLLNVTPLRGIEGGAVVSHLNITDRKQTEEDLRDSEERLRILVESATDYAIFTLDENGTVDSWNSGAENVFGYPEAEIIGRDVSILFTPEDRAALVHEGEMKTAAEKGRAEDERWHFRKDESRFYASGVMTRLDKDGEPRGFAKIARDMTEKMRADKILREKETLAKLVGAQEDERKRLARDLHDHLGQQLTVLRMRLEAMRQLCEDEHAVKICAKVDEVQTIARTIDGDLDFLAWELRPASLDDLGLNAALQDYIKEWQKHSGITAELNANGLNVIKLLPEIETNIYRIAQEALNNIWKHALAKHVSVIVKRQIGDVLLIIEDDGIGFDPEEKSAGGGFGLIGMRERAALVGGTVEIESRAEQGATIFVRIPFEGIRRD